MFNMLPERDELEVKPVLETDALTGTLEKICRTQVIKLAARNGS
jgi:hypothetical protein